MDSESERSSGVSCGKLAQLYDDPGEELETLQGVASDASTVAIQHSVFRALANEDRLRLLAVLREGERCACELEAALDAPQSTVATHLRTLRDAGLVKRRRKGKWSYYRLADGAVLDILDLASVLEGE